MSQEAGEGSWTGTLLIWNVDCLLVKRLLNVDDY